MAVIERRQLRLNDKSSFIHKNIQFHPCYNQSQANSRKLSKILYLFLDFYYNKELLRKKKRKENEKKNKKL